MPHPEHSRKLLADLESARDAYCVAAEDFERVFPGAAEHPDQIENLKSVVYAFHDVANRYQTALDAYLGFLRLEG